MKSKLFAAVSAVGLAMLASPAPAQHHHGAHAPAAKKAPAKKPAAKKPAPKKPAAKKTPARKSPETKPVRKAPAATPAPLEPVVDHSKMDHAAPPAPAEPAPAPPVDHSQMDHAAPPPAEPAPAPPVDHSQMGHGAVSPAGTAPAGHDSHAEMTGALGRYPMTRESSGTAWQPDASEHMGLLTKAGDWDLMAHGVINLVYDRQSGRRGDDMTFVSGMVMGMVKRPLGDGTLQFRASLSPDPLMGKRGYPLLLASGETANGVDRLIDRQHPHDFFMELSVSASQNIGPKSSLFLYAALPGEPAFGPPAFMHREAILDSPEAPITHHWLDSTHISFGVLTGGLVLDRLKLEVSRFNGREPDQHRWNIETAPLDSTAARLSWNPTDELSLQGSWGRFIDPEQLEPGVNQTRWSASAHFAREIAPGWKLAGTLAWGRKSIKDHHDEWLNDDAFVLESSLKHGSWTLFGRGEITENRELVELDGGEHGPAFRVGKISAGAVHDFRLAGHVSLGLGGLLAVNFVPDGLASLYGGDNPTGAMAFVRLKLD